MQDEENWEYYSAALVKLQVKFVKDRPPNVKDLIRLVKYWRKTYIPQIDHERLPPSYLLELLTIHAWEKAKCPKKFNIKIGFKAVMELLENHSNLRVSWDDNYSKSIFIKYRYFHGVFRISLPEKFKEVLSRVPVTFSRTQSPSDVCKSVTFPFSSFWGPESLSLFVWTFHLIS